MSTPLHGDSYQDFHKKETLEKKVKDLLHTMEVPRYLLVSLKDNGEYIDRVETIVKFIKELEGN